MQAISIIIPLAPNENTWPNLRQDLQSLPQGIEVIWISQHPLINRPAPLPHKTEHWIQAAPGRASALNAGAQKATHPWLWFLHADTRFSLNTFATLSTALNQYPKDIHYFNLAFADSQILKLNAAGAWLRSHLWGLPFGDQGFCMSQKVFTQLQGYPEQMPYGEDHLLMWRAKQCNIKVRCTGGTLITSGRKYRQQGWLKTTLMHQYLWIKQVCWSLLKLYLPQRYKK